LTLTRKSRRIGTNEINTSYLYYDGTLLSTHTASFIGAETTFSEGHAWPPRKRSKIVDRGGPFLNQKRIIESHPCDLGTISMKYGGVIRRYNNLKIYAGGFGNRNFTDADFRSDVPTVGAMNALGATGIARASPVRSMGGIGAFIGELRDIPRLPTRLIANGKGVRFLSNPGNLYHHIADLKERVRFFKELGNHYLNIEFGWKPFVNDLLNTVSNVTKTEKRLAYLLRNNGRIIRRKVVINNSTYITGTSTSNFAAGYPVVESEFIDAYGKLKWERRESAKSQFTGAFKYYLDYHHGTPMTPKLHRQLMRILYGADFSPATAYKLLPWTWLSDWFTNISDNLDNMVSYQNDSLTIVYGYVCDIKQTVDQYTLAGARIAGREVGCTQADINQYIGRTKSTPYGFGLDPFSFSLRQGAIVAALGLSRSKPQHFR